MASKKNKSPKQASMHPKSAPNQELVLTFNNHHSNEQKKFNQLTSEILQLGEQLDKMKTVLPSLHSEVERIQGELEVELIELQYQLITAMDEYYHDMKLSKAQKNTVEDYIMLLIEQLPVQPPEDIQIIYQNYTGISYQDFKTEQKEALNEEISDLVEKHFGVKIKLNFDPEQTEEEILQYYASKLREAGIDPALAAAAYGKRTGNSAFQKRKGKNKEETHFGDAEIENIRQKSFKAIYTDLMKIFHPDFESDPILKTENEEISKQITIAYHNQDFYALLKLEAQYLKSQSKRLQSLPPDHLNYYIKMLENQKNQIRSQIEGLKQQYSVVYHEMFKKNDGGKKYLRTQTKFVQDIIKLTKDRISILKQKNPNDKKLIIEAMEEELIEGLLQEFNSLAKR